MIKFIKENWPFIILLLGILVLIRVDPFNTYVSSKSVEELQKYHDLHRDDEIKSSVIEKYVAAGSHFFSFKSGDSIHFRFYSRNENYSLNNLLQEGDSVVKYSGSDTIRVIRISEYEKLDEMFIFGREVE
ncbi:hypothetical protein [Ekhidna sp.]|jgi:hypothetical protein|uniref:hypothetical protein n=1 Tax=Ekhidna sp. TaxID=2608089 RepID=UPI0032EE586F